MLRNVALLLSCLSFVLLPFQRASSASSGTVSVPPDQPAITTLAGSGKLGIADGPAATASFIAPAGLAYGTDGTLFVADRGAQRIRRIGTDGIVSTLAGSGNLVPLGVGVPGGFANGEGAKAKFNQPEGLAVLANGTILVADMHNSCIRAIERGVVRTYAGRCRTPGGTDGAVNDARFGEPRSVAVDAKGVIFIVDPPNGIRRIDNGIVSTLKTAHGVDAISVTTVSKPTDTLLVTTATAIDAIDPVSGKVRYELPLDISYVRGASREGYVVTGPATGVAAFAEDDFVFVDPLDGAVFLGQNSGNGNYIRVLGAVPALDASTMGSSYLDGDAGSARFDEPYAVAVAPDQRIAVADLGNRRIRVLSTFNHDSHVLRADNGTELPDSPDMTVTRIAVVGDSYIASVQGWDDSIAGKVQRLVNQDRQPGEKRIQVYPVMRAGATIFELLSLVDDLLADVKFDTIVLDVPDRGQFPSANDSSNALFPSGWTTRARQGIIATRQRLAANGTRLVLLLHPGALDLQDDMAYRYVYKGEPSASPVVTPIEDPADVQGYRNDVLAAVAKTEVPVVDSWPDIVADYELADRKSLFGTWDHHFTEHARSIVAAALARYFDSVATKSGR